MEGEDRQIVDLSELCDSGNQDGNGTMAEDQWGKAVIDGDIEVITYGDLQIVRGADETKVSELALQISDLWKSDTSSAPFRL